MILEKFIHFIYPGQTFIPVKRKTGLASSPVDERNAGGFTPCIHGQRLAAVFAGKRRF